MEPNIVKLAAALPKGRWSNGLNAIAELLTTIPEQLHIGVVLFTTSEITHNVPDNSDTPKIEIVAIEPIFGDEAKAARSLLEEAYSARTGEQRLFTDDELRSATPTDNDDPDED